MLMSHFKRLWISSVFIILASPMQAAPTVASTPNSLPQALQQNVPQCAQSCLRSSLDERFPVACSGQESLQCLCSRYSNAGESLGEVALGCIYLSCPMEDAQASLSSTYGICLGQKDAVMPTKSVLTYVVTSATRTMSPTISLPTTTSTPVITSSSRIQSSSTQTAFADTVPSLPSATSSATSSPVAATTASNNPPKMTPAQIAGLSVAAVAAFVMAIGLMALSVCLRRRKERRVVFDGDEKGETQRGKQLSTRFSHYVQVGHGTELPKQFPLAPPRAFCRGSKQGPARPAQRLGVGTSNSSSNSSLPLDQIGLAISAELDGKPVVPQKAPKVGTTHQKAPLATQSHTSTAFRPVSTMTQETVFEEDETSPHRRSSMLLPTPPVPIPPIRALQPSRRAPNFAVNQRSVGRGSELFLNIPVRHERPQPKQIAAAATRSHGAPLPPQAQPATRPRLAPPFQMTSTATSYESKATTASSRDASTSGDIIDYYFSSGQSRDQTPKASPARIVRPKESPKTVQIKSKKSHGSTLSRTTSRTSTNLRDSLNSQTSFETTNANDSTPEDEDEDKQLSDDSASNKQQLSPVAESPISKLRYPKVPRSSNQLVPRSPKSSPQQQNFRSPRRAPDASALLQKRNNALPPLLLESRPRLESPHRDPFTSPPRVTSPPRRARSHMRSNSTESWSTTPASKTGIDRKSRVQSGAWGRSPVMYEEDVVRPLNVRRRRDEMSELNIGRDVNVDFDRDGLKSPAWVPRLTPRKKGEDLFLEVGWR